MSNTMRVFFTHVSAKQLVNDRFPFDGRHVQASGYIDGWRVVWLRVGSSIPQSFIEARLKRVHELGLEVQEWEEKE